MNEIINKFLLTGEQVMGEIHLRQPGITYSACGQFPQIKERIQKLKEAINSRYIYQNKLDKARFQHERCYEDFKDLPRRTASYKVLRDNAFNITKNKKHDLYQKGLASVVLNFLIKGVLVLLLKVKLYQTSVP